MLMDTVMIIQKNQFMIKTPGHANIIEIMHKNANTLRNARRDLSEETLFFFFLLIIFVNFTVMFGIEKLVQLKKKELSNNL